MKIFIGLVTPDEALRHHYGTAKDGVVPRDAARRGYFQGRSPVIATAAYAPDTEPSATDFERFLLRESAQADACLLLIDQSWASLTANCRTAAFTIDFHLGQVDVSKQNFFHRVLARALRSYGQIAAKFDRADSAQLLGLPLRNFNAPELRELARLCTAEAISPTLSDDVERQLAQLRRRVRPRRRSAYKTVYVVDDRQRFFKYGYERHSRFETGGSHKPYCELTGDFRFGRRLDLGRHYNVSETENDRTSIGGDFYNCHGETEMVTSRSHLNMFSNDNF